MNDRFWISTDFGDNWKEVDLDFWVGMEQACGFHGGRPATAGFTSGSVSGHMHYSWQSTPGDCDLGPHAS